MVSIHILEEALVFGVFCTVNITLNISFDQDIVLFCVDFFDFL